MLVLLKHTFPLAADIAARDNTRALARRLYSALAEPFAVRLAEVDRRWALAQVSSALDRDGFTEYTRKVIASFEPEVPWEHNFLQTRRDCYRALSDPLAEKAERDLLSFLKSEPQPLELKP
jgi:hypothetical protein